MQPASGVEAAQGAASPAHRERAAARLAHPAPPGPPARQALVLLELLVQREVRPIWADRTPLRLPVPRRNRDGLASTGREPHSRAPLCKTAAAPQRFPRSSANKITKPGTAEKAQYPPVCGGLQAVSQLLPVLLAAPTQVKVRAPLPAIQHSTPVRPAYRGEISRAAGASAVDVAGHLAIPAAAVLARDEAVVLAAEHGAAMVPPVLMVHLLAVPGAASPARQEQQRHLPQGTGLSAEELLPAGKSSREQAAARRRLILAQQEHPEPPLRRVRRLRQAAPVPAVWSAGRPRRLAGLPAVLSPARQELDMPPLWRAAL